MHFRSAEKYVLPDRRKICTSWSAEKYALLVRRKICTFGPTKNMHFWSDEKYVLLVCRKIRAFGPLKNMHFLVCRKIVLLVSGEIVPLVSGGNSRGGVRLPCPSPPFNATGARAPPGSLPGIPGARGGVNVVLGRRAGEERGYLCMALSCLIRARRRVDAPRPSHRPSSTWTCLWLWSLWSVQAVVT